MTQFDQYTSVRELYQDIRKLYNRIRFSNKSGMDNEHYDFTGPRFNKRIAATEKYTETALKELAELNDRKYARQTYWMSNSLLCCGGYNYTGRGHRFIMAAAIWILDQLTIQGDFDKIYAYLPQDADIEAFQTLPVMHVSYDYSLIRKLTYVLCNRNHTSQDKVWGCLIFDLTEQQKRQLANDPKRIAFDSIISLIDKAKIKEVARNYEKRIWDFYRMAFRAMKLIEDRQAKLDAAVERLQAEARTVLSQKAKAPMPVLRQPTPSETPFLPGMDEHAEKVIKAQQAAIAFHRRSDHETLTDISIINEREKFCEKFADVLPRELQEEIAGFSVDDPFETSFAILYLLDSNSLIPWNYYGAIAVAYTAADQLPFDTSISLTEKPAYNLQVNKKIYRHSYSGYRWENAEDIDGQPVHRKNGKNLAQILYANSNAVFPRVSAEDTKIFQILDELEVQDEAQRDLYTLLLHTMFATYLKSDAPVGEVERETELEPSEDVQTLKAEISALRSLSKAHQTQAHHEASNRILLEQENRELRKTQKAMLRELADLREMVFLAQSDAAEETAEKADTVKFPLKTGRKILSYGGHDTWLKAIKSLLPDVQFVSPDVQPNRDLIRNADEIWIQTNCISHAAFYIIIDIARTNNKQIHYFKYASAEKCAMQLVQSVSEK